MNIFVEKGSFLILPYSFSESLVKFMKVLNK